MKKAIFLAPFIIYVASAFSQIADTAKQTLTEAAAKKTLIRTAANLKTGTSQDVLSSFFKIAFTDLSDGHHFQFNSSLFAIRAKTDSSLWVDESYKNLTFARNFVFGVDYGIDSSYKYKSLSINVKYAVINNRDKNLFSFDYGEKLDTLLRITNDFFHNALNQYFQENPNLSDSVSKLVTKFYYYPTKSMQTDKNSLPGRFKVILENLIKDPKYAAISQIPLESLGDYLKELYATANTLLQQTSLWTIGSQATADKQKLFKKINFNTEYLKGITKNNTSMGLELDIKGNLDVYDTIAVARTYNRNVFSSSAGINWIIYKNKTTQKSYIEFKPAITYNNVFSGLLPSETKSKFTGDGILRFRVTDDLWVPIDIKYDEKGKFFGFLNITSNFDWLGLNKPKSSVSN